MPATSRTRNQWSVWTAVGLLPVLLVGCLATAPTDRAERGAQPLPGKAEGGERGVPAAPATSRTTGEAKAVATGSTTFADPFPSTDKDLIAALEVDSRCAAAGGTKWGLRYGAGGCDSTGSPDGLAAARFSRSLVAEGVFAAGRFVPAAKYRTISRRGSDKDVVMLTCSDMRPSDYDFPVQRATPDFSFLSTAATVCKEVRSQFGRSFKRKLEAGFDGAIAIGADSNLVLRAAVRQHAVYNGWSFFGGNRSVTTYVEVIGSTTAPFTALQSPPETDSPDASVRRVLKSDVYSATSVGGSPRWCVEGRLRDACVFMDACTLLTGWSSYQLHPNCKRTTGGGPVLLDDGSIFTPSTPGGIGVFYKGVTRSMVGPTQRFTEGPRTYSLGDALEIVLVEGHMKWPDGREYTGRFVMGAPL